ncbi:hypothetical protein SLEP1_g45474 [Rubroshorea leprosula]|uniref:Uncharacterized protein n=1 Tax=Rubroshorea leprosula TaxID=152421 RepID=A0AAV5LKT3_9ROSI|nr:hypothetical protein SLEP1_g45474 [Rubroshorea leprosula]
MLESIDLSGNQLSGSIPDNIEQLSKLVSIYLYDNQLSGSIPDSIGQLSKVKSINLSGNQLNGSIPDSIWQLSKLVNISLSDNNLTRKIPPCFGKFWIMVNATQLIHDIDYAYWDEATLMEVVKGRYLEYTRKTLRFEISLDLSRKIPEKIEQMENLESLNFSKNGLLGTILNNMSSLTKLSHLNLSYNNLLGLIPTSYQLQTLDDPTMYVGNPQLYGAHDPTMYAGNPQLCGALLLKKCSNDALALTTASFKDNDKTTLKKCDFTLL